MDNFNSISSFFSRRNDIIGFTDYPMLCHLQRAAVSANFSFGRNLIHGCLTHSPGCLSKWKVRSFHYQKYRTFIFKASSSAIGTSYGRFSLRSVNLQFQKIKGCEMCMKLATKCRFYFTCCMLMIHCSCLCHRHLIFSSAKKKSGAPPFNNWIPVVKSLMSRDGSFTDETTSKAYTGEGGGGHQSVAPTLEFPVVTWFGLRNGTKQGGWV